jgi:hypothetical protein
MNDGPELELALGIAAFIAAVYFLIKKVRPLYFGLSILCLFMVSTTSFAAYAHSVVFGLELDWVTPAHEVVIRYSIVGCLAMVGGIALAWLPGRQPSTRLGDPSVVATAPWINPTFAWFVFGVGSAAMLAEVALHHVPTVGTAVHALANFAILGLLVALAIAMKDRQVRRIGLMLAIYIPITLMQAFATGHTPAKVSLLIPAICIMLSYHGINLKTVAVVAVSGVFLLALMGGWLKTRDIIRTGHLRGMSFSQKVQTFLPLWFDATWESALDMRAGNETIRLRIDGTEILAMQVRHQPKYEPFAHGRTVLDSGVALVPRALWRNKPVIAGGAAFVSKYTGMVRDPKDTTSIGLPYQFELYANGGASCVVVGLFVIGYLCGKFERGLFAPTVSLASLFSRLSLTMTLCSGGERADTMIPSLIAGGLTYYVVGRVVEMQFPLLRAKLLGRRPGVGVAAVRRRGGEPRT